jgi:hypothetical protein
MTKGASTIKRKSELDLARDLFTDLGLQYLKHWTQQELAKYRTEPVVIPVGDYRFFIGPYQITGKHQHCWTVTQFDDRQIHDFVDKTTAILYCMYATRRNYTQANNLLDLDYKVGRLDLDIKHYEWTLKASSKRKDMLKYDIVLNRCINAKMQRRELIDILKKTLISAKYLNFRNNRYETNGNGHQTHSKKN